MLADAGAPDDLAAGVLDDADPLAVDRAARALSSGDRRLLVIDDIDHGGAAALRLLETVAARAAASETAVVVMIASAPKGFITSAKALAGELRRATGLAGRPRRASADAERARVNVTRTLRAAIARIASAAPIAGAHLDSSVRTGIMCRYQPAPGGPARWHT